MHTRRLKLLAAVFLILAAVAMAGCTASSSSATSATSASKAPATAGAKVSGGVAEYPEIGEGASSWIWPFMPLTQYDIANMQFFQWQMYRPLYMFGNDGDSTLVNYPLSLAAAPVYADGGRTVVINLKGWKWSDGEVVNAQDIIFWLNMMKAEKANYAGYAPGLMPDNLVSYTATGPDQVTLHLNHTYSTYWFTYNQLAEITPMPETWDVTSLSGKPGSGGCEVSVAKCAAVYAFLTAQAEDTKTYATSKIWGTVDGPWRLTSFTTAGNDSFVPNRAYSGSPKPQLSEFKLVTYLEDSAGYTALKAGKLDMGRIPLEDLPQGAPGTMLPATNPLGPDYKLAPWIESTIFYYIPNMNNPVMGPVFRQLYIRQALQEVEDQPSIDAKAFRGYAIPGSGAVPSSVDALWEPTVQKANGGQGPYPFSITAARSLLTGHGWRESGGVMTCQKPGTDAGQCGAGIARGKKLAFSLDWGLGFSATPQMMAIYKADAARAGIDITLVAQPFQTVLGESTPCSPGPKCTWDALYYGSWIYDGPGFEPTGEYLFQTGAAANSGSYSSPTEDGLITQTQFSSSLAVFRQYATYNAKQVPFIWMPDEYGVWGVSAKLHNVSFSPIDTLLPEYWYYTK
jgi:peptide/nickel transport system substrate-binding protein